VNAVKRWLFWSFSRGSFQYDVLCALILILMFAVPPAVFNDRPEYMRVPETGIRQTIDDDGIAIYTVKVEETGAGSGEGGATEAWAVGRLGEYLDGAPDVFRSEQIRDTRGRVVAFAFWLR
jgi:hypothetical protein